MFQVVMQEKTVRITILLSVSAPTVANSPVLGAQAEPPWQREIHTCTGTNKSADHRYNHFISAGGGKNCEKKT